MNKLAFFISILIFASCKKDSSVNATPKIKFLSINSTEIQQFKDSLIVNLEYEDGDGNIGEENPDKNSLYVKDRRLTEADYFFVKPLSPPNSKIAIKGVLSIKIKNAFLLGTANQEQTVFEIKLKDNSGNWSNQVVTPEINIKK